MSISIIILISFKYNYYFLFFLFFPLIIAIAKYLLHYKSTFAITDKTIVFEKGYFKKINYHFPVKNVVSFFGQKFKDDLNYISLQLYNKDSASLIKERVLIIGPIKNIIEAEVSLHKIISMKREKENYTDIEELKAFYETHKLENKLSHEILEGYNNEYCIWIKENRRIGIISYEAFWITNKRIFYIYKEKNIIIPLDKIRRISLNKDARIRLTFMEDFTVHKTNKGQQVMFFSFSNEQEQKQVFEIIENSMEHKN